MNESKKTDGIDATSAKNYLTLLAEYRARKSGAPIESSFVKFEGIEEEKDAYNPSGPFSISGNSKIFQWARVESRTAQDAVSMLFEQTSENVFSLVKNIPALPMEDPFTAQINDQIVVGGVEISKDEHQRVIGYHTVFYRGRSLESLTLFAEGPNGMKDIRLATLLENAAGESRILVFTRPHIPLQARMMGRIAVTTIASLDELTIERLVVEHTEIIPDIFTDTEWGGVNDVYIFGPEQPELVGVLCHIAKFDENNKRHYAAAAFVFNTESHTCSPLEMIAERADFPMGPIKIMPENLDNPEMYDDLADVIFSSRLVSLDGTMLTSKTLALTCGLSDAATGMCIIPNPFPKLISML